MVDAERCLDVKFELVLKGGQKISADFQCRPGITVLFGPSGAGKTTTLDAIAGLLRPQTGRIKQGAKVFFDANEKINCSPQQRQVGYVFQQAALFPHMNVRQNIAFALNENDSHILDRKLSELAALLSIENFLERKVSEISGGQRQRVALARALATNPKIFLFDEPLSALALKSRDEMTEVIKTTQRRLGIPVLYVTHSPTEAKELADLFLQFVDGVVRQS
jgi:molybdate transport system ATP-binding protein